VTLWNSRHETKNSGSHLPLGTLESPGAESQWLLYPLMTKYQYVTDNAVITIAIRLRSDYDVSPISVSGPTVWIALPDYLRNPTLTIDVFKSYLNTFLLAH